MMNRLPSLSRPALTGTLTALCSLLLAPDAAAQTLRVSTYGVDSNSGLTWPTSLRTVRRALNIAAADPGITRIEVAAGTYKPGGSRGLAFELVSGVTIVGGYPAAGGSSPDADANPTILSGDIGVAGDSSDNSHSVLLALGVHDVRLEGLRIRGGNADNPTSGGPATFGGALYAQGSSLQFFDCRFHDNYAIYGGAAGLVSSAVTFSRCRFVDNHAMSGGALACVVWREPDDVLIDRCTFLGNQAQIGGAVFNMSNLSAYDSVFSGNIASDHGGAVYAAGNDHRTLVANCTLANNKAGLDGHAYYAFDVGSTTLVNSICWGTGADASRQVAPAGTFAHHCDVQGLAACGLSGYSNFDANPLFVDALGPDGAAGTADDDLHLRHRSPCVQAGDNAAVPIYAMRDIDDEARIQVPLPHLPGIVDVGADEVGLVR